MRPLHIASTIVVGALLAACASNSEKGTIAELRKVRLDLADERIEGGIEKAMLGYQRFLEETPESAMTPEAMRRLADLKIEKEYGVIESTVSAEPKVGIPVSDPLAKPEAVAIVVSGDVQETKPVAEREGEAEFEARATQMSVPEENSVATDLENRGAEEAIALYKELLEKYPLYERNDQVLYQLTRAYEELGQVEEAVEVMGRIVSEYPDSRYIDEIHFRRGEFYFTRKKYLRAEEAYLAIAKIGSNSFYYELALYKLGWTFYKQDMHKEAMDQFVALLDYKIDTGYDFENPVDDFEQKRIEDTHRVISLSLSAMGGPESVVSYFDNIGPRSYEVDIYRNLGEYYLEKRRYADAASSYKTFVQLNPYHKVSPHFDTRVVEIYKKGGFPKLVIDANKQFATNYGRKSEYWKHFEVDAFPDVLVLLKSTLSELANYYHALYQNKKFVLERSGNFDEAKHWYREFLDSFPRDSESPVMNYQLADLLLENKSFHDAAFEYERTAYDYPVHEKAAAAGYAAVYTHRENLVAATHDKKIVVKRDVIRSSLRFSEAFPQHEKASLVMGAALEDIFAMKEYEFALVTGKKMLVDFPSAPDSQLRAAWLVVAHSSFELSAFPESENGYMKVLELTSVDHDSRSGITENLAASIYKQGEQENINQNYQLAADHFLRLGVAAPNSKLRPSAEYDAATALMKLGDWPRSTQVLLAFRENYQGHKLQPDITIKLATAYSESGRLLEAAAEYERIETEAGDETLRRESLKVAADLYIQAGSEDKAIEVYRRFINYFPEPREQVMEMQYAIATILRSRSLIAEYHWELKQVVRVYEKSGQERSDRMRYLAGVSELALTEPLFADFAQIKLVLPLEANLKKKRNAMKAVTAAFQKLLKYELGEVNAAATFYIAEAYSNFSAALINSERPGGMDELETEQYEMLLDEQSYPFEEQSISIHKKNVGFIGLGIYNDWVDKSIVRLAEMEPGRYARFEESSGFITSASSMDYQALTNPLTNLPAPVAAEVVTAVSVLPTAGEVDAGQHQVETKHAAVEEVDSLQASENSVLSQGEKNVLANEISEQKVAPTLDDVTAAKAQAEDSLPEEIKESKPTVKKVEKAGASEKLESAEDKEAVPEGSVVNRVLAPKTAPQVEKTVGDV